MHDNLFVGMTIYHKTGKTPALITGIDQDNIIIELSKEIACKKVLTLPITHIGEWIFFNENDVELSASILSNRLEYIKYKNQKILDAYNNNIEQKKRIEAEEQRKALELSKQREIELQRQEKLEKKLELEIHSKTNFINMLKSNYQFDGFHHYSDFKNFLDIMNTGKLLSRNEALKRGFTDSADQDVIGKTPEKVKDYVRFYYKEKTPTLYNNEGIKINNSSPHMPLPVLLLFNENIINHHTDIAFTSGCGGSKYSRITKNIQDATTFDWETIFSRCPIPTDENSLMACGWDINKATIINKRNAEFLVNKEIDVKHIKKIIFRSPADKKHAELMLGKNKLYEIDKDRIKFNYTHNFLYDYEINPQNDNYIIALIFDKYFEDYSHELKIYYDDKTMEELNIIEIDELRRIDLQKPEGYENYDYYFMFKPLPNKKSIRIEYFMNGHLSALWEE